MVHKLFLYATLAIFIKTTHANEVTLHFDAVPLPEFSKVVLGDLMESGYALEEGISDKKISLYAPKIDTKNLHELLNDLLASSALIAEKRKGIYHIKQLDTQNNTFIYKPKYRTVKYISDLFKQAFPDIDTNKNMKNGVFSENTKSDIGASQFASNNDYDYFIANAPSSQHKAIKTFVELIDIKNQTLNVTGASYEVSTNKSDSSAISIVGELLGNIGITLGGSLAGSVGTFSITGLGLTAILSMFDSDSRFKGLSKPSLLVDSGQNATFNAGQDVPILSNTTVSNGQVTQGIEYVKSGVLLTVKPTILDEIINLNVTQEFSSFQRNQLSNIQSPLLNKRLVDTSVSLKDGDVIVLGGLTEERTGRNKQYVGNFPVSDSNETNQLETIIILQVTKI